MDTLEKIHAKLSLVRHPAYSDLVPATNKIVPKQENVLKESTTLSKRIDSYIIDSLGQRSLGKITNKAHRQNAQKLRGELERLIIALSAHFYPDKETLSQEMTLRIARGLLRLNERSHNGETIYNWQRYCIEQSLGEKLAKRLLALKKTLPESWVNRVRDEAHNFAKAFECYLKLSRKELGRLH